MTRVFTDAGTSDRSSRINCEQLYSLLMYRQILEIRQFHILNGKWPKACCKNNPRFLRKGKFSRYCLIDTYIQTYLYMPLYTQLEISYLNFRSEITLPNTPCPVLIQMWSPSSTSWSFSFSCPTFPPFLKFLHFSLVQGDLPLRPSPICSSIHV